MADMTRALSPQAGIAAFLVLAAATLTIDAYHAKPAIEAWLESRHEAAPLRVRETAAAFGDLSVPIETSTGALGDLKATNGRVRIATMFYAHCSSVCPMTVATLQRIENALAPAERAQLGVLLLSLDPARDEPSTLQSFAVQRGIDAERWLVARTSADDVGVVARAIGISYQKEPTRVLEHSAMLVLLDANGQELARSEANGKADTTFLTAVRDALAGARS